MLRQSGQFRASQLEGECILDSNDLERERGITILAKNIAINYGRRRSTSSTRPATPISAARSSGTLQMADGALVLVDAAEGPMPQTRFVLRKAFANKLRPIVVINKIDRPDARPNEVLDEVFDIFIELGADEQQLDFPYIFASGKGGFATHDPHATSGDIQPAARPDPRRRSPARRSIPTGRCRCSAPRSTGPSTSAGSRSAGSRRAGSERGQKVALIKAGGRRSAGHDRQRPRVRQARPDEVEEAEAGDIVAVVGLGAVDIGDTIADPETPDRRCPGSRSTSRR